LKRFGKVRQPPGAELCDKVPSWDRVIEVAFLLRSRRPASAIRADLQALALTKPDERTRLDWKQFDEIYSVTPADLNAMKRFEAHFRMRLVEEDSVLGYHVVKARIRDFEKALKIKIVYFNHTQGRYRSYLGSVQLPAKMAPIVTAVLGLDDRKTTVPHVHHGSAPSGKEVEPAHVAHRYKYPKDREGCGQTIAIIELGGGFYPADVRRQFKEHYKTPPPKISVVSIHHQRNRPARRADLHKYLDAFASLATGDQAAVGRALKSMTGEPDLDDQIRWTIEASMDVQLTGALAPGANLKVYFAPNTGHGKFHALAAALRDPEVSVVSCSWGARENFTSDDFVRGFEDLLTKAALLGVTICCSSGDDFLSPHNLHVFYPASSPLVLSCGGTHLKRWSAEQVWNEEFTASDRVASTGGASRLFAAPSWQGTAALRATGRNGRGVPDVAAKADIKDGYSITVAGRLIPMGGTSAAAPAWAALIARLNERNRARLGYFTQLLYTKAFRSALTDITTGTNGAFRARVGWDACTGLGSPVGAALLLKLFR
jgi:kumamolisin